MSETSNIDDAGPVRSGEEIDAASVGRFLRDLDAGLSGVPAVRQFAGGASNLTYLLRYPDRDLVLRRPPFGHRARSAHDVVREARVLEALAPAFPRVPRVVAICTDPTVMAETTSGPLSSLTTSSAITAPSLTDVTVPES